jgi:hypothetical protein
MGSGSGSGTNGTPPSGAPATPPAGSGSTSGS